MAITAKLVPVLDAISRRVNMQLHELILTPIFVKPGINGFLKAAMPLINNTFCTFWKELN